MIHTLVQSAFQTGCLSVESEGLIRQVLAIRGYKAADLEVLEKLYSAVHSGIIKREASGSMEMPLQRLGSGAGRG
uniref:hypothetical protein n=1 Tax=Trichocoleus desertorum TaxID=1481672 RepID=UPI0025B4EF3E|nr:hypothetical protein [Trichocoleus desertorum]